MHSSCVSTCCSAHSRCACECECAYAYVHVHACACAYATTVHCVCMCMCMCLRIRARKHAVHYYPHASRAPPPASTAPLPGLTPQSVPLDLKSKPTKQGLKRRTEKVSIVQSLLVRANSHNHLSGKGVVYQRNQQPMKSTCTHATCTRT